MKLELDLVRQLLLFLEQRDTHNAIRYTDIQIEGYSSQQIGYHLNRMFEAGFISGEAIRSNTTPERIVQVIPFDLTWKGHEFLDAVRDPEIWKKTKQGAQTAGAAGIEFLWGIATAYGKHVIKDKLGIDLA